MATYGGEQLANVTFIKLNGTGLVSYTVPLGRYAEISYTSNGVTCSLGIDGTIIGVTTSGGNNIITTVTSGVEVQISGADVGSRQYVGIKEYFNPA